MTSSSELPVLIAGTGPSGLLLGHALKKANIPFRLFEKDSGVNIRGQGYRFKINKDAVSALQSILTPSHFNLVTEVACANVANFTKFDAITGQPQSQDVFKPKKEAKGLEMTGEKAKEMNAGLKQLCIDRTLLRAVLLRGLEDEISFDHKITGYTLSEDGSSVAANFTDGTSVNGSLLVAADGGWSTIRKQYLPDFNPVDIEARFFYGKTPITPEVLEKVNKDVLSHMTIITDNSKELPITLLNEPMRFYNRALAEKSGMELPADYIYWAFGARKDRLDIDSLGERPTSEACAAFIKNYVQDVNWDPSFKALVELQNVSQTAAFRIQSMEPKMPVWESTRVTLIGDAAHCMSPTSGVGASIALRDSALLGRLLAEMGVGVEAVKEFEREMRGWPQEAVLVSEKVGKMIFGMRDFAELKASME